MCTSWLPPSRIKDKEKERDTVEVTVKSLKPTESMGNSAMPRQRTVLRNAPKNTPESYGEEEAYLDMAAPVYVIESNNSYSPSSPSTPSPPVHRAATTRHTSSIGKNSRPHHLLHVKPQFPRTVITHVKPRHPRTNNVVLSKKYTYLTNIKASSKLHNEDILQHAKGSTRYNDQKDTQFRHRYQVRGTSYHSPI